MVCYGLLSLCSGWHFILYLWCAEIKYIKLHHSYLHTSLRYNFLYQNKYKKPRHLEIQQNNTHTHKHAIQTHTHTHYPSSFPPPNCNARSTLKSCPSAFKVLRRVIESFCSITLGKVWLQKVRDETGLDGGGRGGGRVGGWVGGWAVGWGGFFTEKILPLKTDRAFLLDDVF